MILSKFATKVVLSLVVEGVEILSERSDNKVDDKIVDIVKSILNPEEILSAAMGDGIEEEEKTKALSEKA